MSPELVDWFGSTRPREQNFSVPPPKVHTRSELVVVILRRPSSEFLWGCRRPLVTSRETPVFATCTHVTGPTFESLRFRNFLAHSFQCPRPLQLLFSKNRGHEANRWM